MNLFSQNRIEKIEKIENDTIFSVIEIYTENGKICEKRYFRSLESQQKYSKEDLFMLGIKPLFILDSVFFNTYDKDWYLSQSLLISNHNELEKQTEYRYLAEQIFIEEQYFKIESKANTNKTFEIEILNPTPQNYELKIESITENIKINGTSEILPNRSSKKYEVEIEIEQGINTSEILITNSNGVEKKIKVMTVGYDLIESDFTKELAESKVVEINRKEKVFIEIKGNEKLLIIKNRIREKQIPVSKLINSINGNLLSNGINNLELVNLATNQIMKIQIKVN